MNESRDKRRMAENEVIFRQHNERVNEGFKKLQVMAREHNQDPSEYDDDSMLRFFCECCDEDCRERIMLRPSRYEEIHENRSRFTIIPGHEVKSIERIVEENDGYSIIEKYSTPPDAAAELNVTDVHKT